jgi:tripartite ATP-independent transporter DctP family solute receptor
MKKVSILVFALALVFASAAYSKAAGEKTFELTGGINLPTTHPYYLGMVKFAELMKKYSNGTVTMEVFPSAQLGNERDVVEALQLGSVDVTLISAAPLSNFTNDFQLFDFPYIFSSREHAYAVLDSKIGRTMMANLSQYGLVGLEFMENGFYWLGSTKPINSLADLKGLKIRSLENEMQVFGYSQWGGNGIAMAFSEVPTSLQNHTLDAVGLTTSVIGVMGLGSNAPYLTKTWHYYAAAPLLMSKATFDQMSEAQQAAVLKAAAEARDYQRKESAACDAEWEATMAKNGVTLSVPKSLDEYYDAMVPGTYKAYVGEGKLINADIYAEVKKLGEQYGGDPGTWRP